MNFDRHTGNASNSSSSSHSNSSASSQDLLPNVLFDQSPPISCPIDVIDRQYATGGLEACDLDTIWDPPTHPELFPGAFVLDDCLPETSESPPPSLQPAAPIVTDVQPAAALAASSAAASVFKEPPLKRRKPSNKQQSRASSDDSASRGPSSSTSASLPSNTTRFRKKNSKKCNASKTDLQQTDKDHKNKEPDNLLDKVPSYLTALSTGPKVVPCNDKPVLMHQAIARSGSSSFCLAYSATPEEAPEAGTCSRLPGYAQEFTNSTLWDGDAARESKPAASEAAAADPADCAGDGASGSSIFKREYPMHGDEDEVQQRRILFIGHLPKEWANPEQELRNIFQRRGLGPIREISVKTRFHRHLDSYAFVYFLHRRDAYAAYDYLQKAAEFRQLNVGFGGRWQYLRGQQYTDLDSLPSVEAESGPVEDLLIEASADVGKKPSVSAASGVGGSSSNSSSGAGLASSSLSSSSSEFGSLLKNYVRMRGGLH